MANGAARIYDWFTASTKSTYHQNNNPTSIPVNTLDTTNNFQPSQDRRALTNRINNLEERLRRYGILSNRRSRTVSTDRSEYQTRTSIISDGNIAQ